MDHQFDLFKGTAYYYARYRPGYPDSFFEFVVDAFGLDGTGRLLDLGCGTGQLAVPLSHHVAGVVGIDPDPEMLAEAEAVAQCQKRSNIRWIQGSDRDLARLTEDLGVFQLVTMGRAFHWMDQDATLSDLDRLVTRDGGIVLTGDPERIWGGTEPWHEAVRKVIQRWLGPERRAGGGAYTVEHDPFEVILQRSPFPRVELAHQTYSRSTTVDDIVGYLYSTSYCSPAVLGNLRDQFEADLRQALHDLESSGEFSERVELTVFLGRR